MTRKQNPPSSAVVRSECNGIHKVAVAVFGLANMCFISAIEVVPKIPCKVSRKKTIALVSHSLSQIRKVTCSLCSLGKSDTGE